MQAYLFMLRDMVSMNAELGIKGPNGFSLCHLCEMNGVQKVADGATNYYISLTLPSIRDDPQS